MKQLHLTGKIVCALILTTAALAACKPKDPAQPPSPVVDSPAATPPAATPTPAPDATTTTPPAGTTPAPDAPAPAPAPTTEPPPPPAR